MNLPYQKPVRVHVTVAEADLNDRASQDASAINPPSLRSEREVNRLLAILIEFQAEDAP